MLGGKYKYLSYKFKINPVFVNKQGYNLSLSRLSEIKTYLNSKFWTQAKINHTPLQMTSNLVTQNDLTMN